MRPALFRKVTEGIIRLNDIRGNVVFLKKGDTITGHYEKFNGLPGLQFERFIEETLSGENHIKQDGNVISIVGIPSKQQIESISKLPTNQPTQVISLDNSEPPDNPNANKDCEKCKGRGKYSFGGLYGGPIHWSVCECVMFKPEPPPKPSITKGFEPDFLKSLKDKTPRDWMLVKKHELKKIMDDAGIDYSQVKDERMNLYKFLFSIIKDL